MVGGHKKFSVNRLIEHNLHEYKIHELRDSHQKKYLKEDKKDSMMNTRCSKSATLAICFLSSHHFAGAKA
ncbi:CLUMA_CG005149, isoform A [Clunio marinus]|uniref:CLUMA_CG005149, isoform A n=1 Tax=Clunio marinus TaxID=568069 RepID=A0A1J1HVA6_9DIPT|nr:CLUMA_CG005149, isoform A [Clunio marinus]